MDRLHDVIMSYDFQTILEDDKTRVNRISKLTEKEKKEVWSIIQDGFAALNARSAHKQDMEYEEYIKDIENPDVLKFVSYDKQTGDAVGFLSVHVGLNSVSWVDHDKIQAVQDAEDPLGVPYYISTFVVPPSMKGMYIGSQLLKASLINMYNISQVSSRKNVAFYDCAEANYPGIPLYVQRVTEELSTSEVRYSSEEIFSIDTTENGVTDTQHYFYLKHS